MTTLSTKPHYPILDALRGIAALMVVAFHILEAHATSHLDQIINHGYLAVDFFFLLSGFVIGYAYDDRWAKMSVKDFFKIRVARLQPMVIMGMIVGAALFYFQDSVVMDGISEVPLWKMLAVMLVGFTLIPVFGSWEIRGWTEMHPLNGPGWSLFYEYIANILYALFVRKFSNTLLAILVFSSGCMLIHLGVTSPKGYLAGGWAIDTTQIHIGFSRLLFPFFGGLLLFRVRKIGKIKNGFLWSTLLLVAILAIPRIGGADNLWMNGLYETLSVIFLFPLVVLLGASGELTGKFSSRISKFLGDISYPIYITHYPFIYLYFAWVYNNKVTLAEAWPISILIFFASITLAYVCLKLYDEPVRLWLRDKLKLSGKKKEVKEVNVVVNG